MKFALRTTLNSKHEGMFEGIMVANSETTFHKHRHCRGLQNAVQSRIKNLPSCKFAFQMVSSGEQELPKSIQLVDLLDLVLQFARSAASSCLWQQEYSCVKDGA